MTFEQLRAWQQRFVSHFMTWVEATYLLVALPGGGKTKAALFAAKQWLLSRVTKRRLILVIVPSTTLTKQWQYEAHRDFQLNLIRTEFHKVRTDAAIDGWVITYPMMVSQDFFFQKMCSQYEVFVIFDEIHHVQEPPAAFGTAIQVGCCLATKRLAMSGTPWRTNGERIPFLTPNDATGEYVAQTTFDWIQALEADPPVVRWLSFQGFHGYAEFAREGKSFRLDTREGLNREDSDRCLGGLLRGEDWCCDLLRAAHQKLLEVRRSKSDARGFVVCMDIDHARRVRQWLWTITGEMPTLATSEEDEDRIEEFRKGSVLWLVSVRQISEGVDIPPLMVGAYLSHWRTELYFRQFVGRLIRNQGTRVDQEAYVFYPHHPDLDLYAEKIKELQACVPRKRDSDGREGPGPEGEGPLYLGASRAEQGTLTLPMLSIDPVIDPGAAAFIKDSAARYNVPETTMEQIRRDWATRSGPWTSTTTEPSQTAEEPPEIRKNKERRTQHKRIGYWLRLMRKLGDDDVTHKQLGARANRACGCAAVELATEGQLKHRRIFIEGQIRACQNDPVLT